MNKEKIKYLELIQNIITRMNSNSFKIKNWMVISISAIFTISLSQKNSSILLVALIPIILYWFLDAYYLMQEKKFRCLYKQVINQEKNLKLFEMDSNFFKNEKYKHFKALCYYCKVLFSKTIGSLYVVMVIIVLVLFCLF